MFFSANEVGFFVSHPKKTNFQKIGSSHFETLGLKVRLVTPEQFIVLRNVPLEFLVNDTKITFYDQKMFSFSEPKLYPYIFKLFLPKRNFFFSNFFDLSFER